MYNVLNFVTKIAFTREKVSRIMRIKECSMKKIIFVLLCVCLLAATTAVFADGEKEGYTVTYYKNNCLALVPEDETVYQYGDEVEVLFEPVEYMNGLIFYGWDMNDDGVADFGYSYRYFDMPKKDVKLKAICITPYYGPSAPAPHHHPQPGPFFPPSFPDYDQPRPGGHWSWGGHGPWEHHGHHGN